MDAAKLAEKVKRVLQKQIRAKGYEAEALLLTPIEKNLRKLNITDTGENTPEPHSENIKIVVTSHGIKENSTELGDNPDEILEFIVIEDGSESELKKVEEDRILIYLGKKYIVELVSPATLAGQLIIKEVTAKAVR
ncbi:hypothetical protein [Paenibacillus rigui]|uniref:Uncharacterized protein n=1 Tax=Paenibacillus rigui TaxID=554312 RepID=A0A229UMK1_9BACL|nr:hypothetical protein [Paenibacillus rigui]OXM84603.1 hypothetical protein CF651_19035 [Paenibacillus rigui]